MKRKTVVRVGIRYTENSREETGEERRDNRESREVRGEEKKEGREERRHERREKNETRRPDDTYNQSGYLGPGSSCLPFPLLSSLLFFFSRTFLRLPVSESWWSAPIARSRVRAG